MSPTSRTTATKMTTVAATTGRVGAFATAEQREGIHKGAHTHTHEPERSLFSLVLPGSNYIEGFTTGFSSSH